MSRPDIEVEWGPPGRFYIPANPLFNAKARSTFGTKWNRSRKQWYAPATPFCCRSLAETFNVIDITGIFYENITKAEAITSLEYLVESVIARDGKFQL